MIILSLGPLHAQLQICGNPINLANDCSDACVTCNLNGTAATTSHTTPGNAPPGYCTAVVHSIRYFAFVAGSTSISFTVTVTGCTLGSSIELGVYETPDCSSFNLVSNCNTAMPVGTHAFSTTSPLKVGCPYYIVIDGNGPAACSFVVAVTSGSATAPTPSINGSIIGRTKVCEGETETYSVNDLLGACESEWEVTNGSVSSQTKTSVTVQWNQAGLGKVCLKAKNPCHEKNFCVDVAIGQNSETFLGTFLSCANQPYVYQGNEYYKGDHEIKLVNYTGCDSTLKFTVDDYPISSQTIDTVLCNSDCISVFGKTICSEGNSVEIGKMKSHPFCDSLVYLTIHKQTIDFSLSKSNDLSCDFPSSTLSIDKFNSSLNYYWHDSSGKLLDSTATIKITEPGTYYLQAKIRLSDGRFCYKTDSIKINGSSLKPKLVSSSDYKLCESAPLIPDSIGVMDIHQTTNQFSYFFKDQTGNYFEIANRPILNKDTVIYVVGQNGNCKDTLAVRIQIIKKIIISLRDSTVCIGTTVFPYQFPVPSVPSGILNLYYSHPDRKNKIDSVILINSDTSWFGFLEYENCSSEFEQKMIVHPLPNLLITGLQSTYCENENIRIDCKLNSITTEGLIKLNNSLQVPIHKDSVILFSSLDTGIHRLQLSSHNEYCSAESDFEFRVFALPTNPVIHCEATDSSILFKWQDDNTRVQWHMDTVITTGRVIAFSDSVLVSNLNQGEEIKIKLSLKDSICGDRTLEEICRAVDCPDVNLDVVARHELCLSSSTDSLRSILVRIINPQQNWNLVFSGKGIIDSTKGIFDPKIAGSGIHKIRIRYFKGLCETIKEIEYHIIQIPDLQIEMDSIVCVNQEIELRISGIKNAEDRDSIELDGALAIQTNNQRTYTLHWDKPGLKRIKFEVNNRFCKKQFYREVRVVPEPLVVNPICNSDLNSISFSWTKSNTVKQYRIELDPALAYTRINDTSIRIINLAPNTVVQCRIISDGFADCASSTGSWISCSTRDCPIVNLAKDSLIAACRKNLPPQIDLIPLLHFPQNKQQFSVDRQPLTDSKINTDLLKSGTHLVVIESSENGCNYQDSFRLIIGDEPKCDVVQTDISCLPDSQTGTIELKSVYGGIPPYQIFFDNQLISQSTIDKLLAGIYSVSLKDSLQCENKFNIEIQNPQDIAVELGLDVEVLKDQNILLEAKISGPYEAILWSPALGLSCTDCSNPNLTASQDQWIYVLVENEDHCTAIDSIFIRVRDEQIYIPNVISANGDGINDYFEIFGSKDIIQAKLRLFDRWGELVFSSQQYPINSTIGAWDGRTKNQLLMPGVYVYSIEAIFRSGATMKLAGEVTVLR
ncbi:MAG TPA: gliding motility-associated C-terminal domain-containing protein [Saprospiraceae bacterium]|nr:gliding motility-associated C-terminal domain-containing protein [Saprospiraceae bacterium]